MKSDWKKPSCRAPHIVAAAITMAAPMAYAGLAVLQVESPFAYTLNAQQTAYLTYGQFSPVTFPGGSAEGTTVAGSGGYAGITFTLADAYSTTGSLPQATPSSSNHAITVGDNFYSSGKAGNPNGTNPGEITDVWVNSTYSFYQNVVQPQPTLDQRQVLPAYLYGGTVAPTGNQVIRIVNNSYVQDYGTSKDENTIRRLDFMAARENAVFVSGAVSQSGTTSVNISWSMWNGLAVRGTNTYQTFDPAAIAGVGKRRADLWTDSIQGYTGLCSYGAGTVSGYAAGLIYQSGVLAAGNSEFAAAGKSEVVRSLMLTGANRSKTFAFVDGNNIATGVTLTWQRETANNLSVRLGAGQASYSKPLAILQAGRRNAAAASGTTNGSSITSPTVYTNLAGWTSDSVAKGNQRVVVFSVPAGKAISDLVASLTWDVSQNTQTQGTNVLLDTRDGARIFADLNLSLVHVTAGGGGSYTLGTSIGYAGLTSNATGDNVESLYWQAGGSEILGAGTYAFLISDISTSSNVSSTAYGFSYSMNQIAVPEPATLSLLAISPLLLRRRRMN